MFKRQTCGFSLVMFLSEHGGCEGGVGAQGVAVLCPLAL